MFKLASSCSLLSLVLVAGLIGCGSGEESVDSTTQLLSTDGAEAVSSNEQATGSLTDATFDVAPSPDPAAAADAVVGAPEEAVDGKCRTRAKDPNDPNTVIITLTNCKGRFGRHSVSGTEIVHFTSGGADTLHAEFASQDLTIDGHAATHSATADVTFTADARHIVWKGGFNTTTEKGEAVVHSSDLTIDVDKATRCRTRSGTAETSVGERGVSTSFEDFKVCRRADGDAACPSGSVTHTRKATGRSVTVDFDGSSTATVTGPNGGTFELQLSCGN